MRSCTTLIVLYKGWNTPYFRRSPSKPIPPKRQSLHKMPPSILGPIIVLNLWTFVMELWMCIARMEANAKLKISLESIAKSTKEENDRRYPPHVRWKADNYNHLLEQPTQFYALALTLALISPEDTLSTQLAWGYVGIRIVHSLVHSIGNIVRLRGPLFILSSSVLLGLTARAALAILWRVCSGGIFITCSLVGGRIISTWHVLLVELKIS